MYFNAEQLINIFKSLYLNHYIIFTPFYFEWMFQHIEVILPMSWLLLIRD